MQEALEAVKRELGPEAVVLQTRNHKKGFGLMSKSSVEVTAAVPEKSMLKKQYMDAILPNEKKKTWDRMSASDQKKVFDQVEQAKFGAGARPAANPAVGYTTVAKATPPVASKVPAAPAPKKSRLTATRYIDIQDTTPAAAQKIAVENVGVQKAMAALDGAQIGVQEEIEQLKKTIEELRKAHEAGLVRGELAGGPDANLTPELQDAFQALVMNGVDRKYALPLVRQVQRAIGNEKAHDREAILDQMAYEIMERVEVLPLLKGIRTKEDPGFSTDTTVIAIVGPTGVGKTTTVAKIASDAILRRKMKVGLINIDSYKVAAHDQLATYARILNVPFRSVATKEELDVALKDFGHCDLVLIDTTGRSQRDTESLTKMRALLSAFPQIRTELVLSSTTRDQELYETGVRFQMFKPEGLIVSKLDESMTHGCLYNASQKLKLPLMYFTVGQRVPEDIEEASKERVVALVMDLV